MLNVKDIASDWVNVGTMLVVSRWLTGGSVTDNGWQMGSLFTLLGFTAYHLTTKNLLPTSSLEGTKKAIADDWIKVSTMMIVSRMLAGGSFTDADWIRGSLATLVGFTIYQLVTANYVKGSELATNDKLQGVVDDWAKVSTMLVVSRILTCEAMDANWVMSSLATLLGFTAYRVGTSHIIDAVFPN